MPDAIGPVMPATSDPLAGWDAASAVGVSTQDDKDMFLKLLVAQLKNQDVSNPMDPSQMMSQMAQLTTVDKLNELVAGQDTQNAAGRLMLAANLAGKYVEWDSGGGVVSQVRFDGGDIYVRVGQIEINAGDIAVVRPASTPTNTAPVADGDETGT